MLPCDVGSLEFVSGYDCFLKDRIKLSSFGEVISERIFCPILADAVRDLFGDPITTWPAYVETVFEKSRPLLYGARYKEGSVSVPGIHVTLDHSMLRTELFANITSVEELKYFMLKFKQVLDYIFIPETELPNFSVSDTFRLSVQNALNSQDWEEVESLIIPIALGFLGRARVYYDALVMAALLFLSRIYQYWIGLLDRGGGKIYSSGSLEFRSIYISIVLFQGAYIWIKFRDVAPESNQRPSPGLVRKYFTNELGEKVYYGKFEPRFKPPGSKKYIYVGRYEEEKEAKACNQIFAFLYGKQGAQGELPLGDGFTYPIPGMPEEMQRLGPEEKKKWAKEKVKDVLSDYQILQKFLSREAHPTGNPLPPDLPECLDVSARTFVPSGSIGVQADEAHPYQLCNEGGDLGPEEGWTLSGHIRTPSGYVGGDESNPTPHAISQPEVATNIATSATGESIEQPLESQRPETRLQGNQANDSAVNMIIDDFSLQRDVKELQRERECQQLKIQHLEKQNSLLETQQEQLQSRMQRMENRFLAFEGNHQQVLLQKKQLESRLQELEGKIEVLRSGQHARKRHCTNLVSRLSYTID